MHFSSIIKSDFYKIKIAFYNILIALLSFQHTQYGKFKFFGFTGIGMFS